MFGRGQNVNHSAIVVFPRNVKSCAKMFTLRLLLGLIMARPEMSYLVIKF